MANEDHRERQQEDQILRLAVLMDSVEENLRRINRVLDGIERRCAEKHSKVERDLGRLDGRASGISALVAFIVSALIAFGGWIVNK